MKKLFLLFVLCATVSAWAVNESVPFKTGPMDFPSAFGGILFSDATRAMYREPKADLRDYIVLGRVTGTSSMENVLLLINLGDTGLHTLKSEALKRYPQADDIVNVEIDAHTYNILLIYCKTTVTLRGVAVKYKNGPRIQHRK